MAISSYSQYSDAKLVWLGKLPSHWQMKRLKFLAHPQPSNVDKKTVEDEIPVRLCNYVDVYKNDFIDSKISFMAATASVSEIEKFKLNIGDVIVTKDSETPQEIAIPALVVEEADNLICGYHLTQIKSQSINGRFLFRLFQSKGFNAQFIVQANGVTRFGLPSYAIDNAFVPIPPPDEQQKIADFLDYKTALIDALIAKKETLLLKLQEKRSALITQAVTKGINPNVPMKPSGVEWLGAVPARWEVKRMRFGLTTNPSKNELDLKEDDLVSFIPMEAVGEYGGLVLETEKEVSEIGSGYTYFKDEDVVVAKITPCFENGKGAIAKGLKNKTAFGTTELHVLRASAVLNPDFLFQLTISYPFRKIGESEMYGAGGQKRVPETFVKDFKIGFPSLTEQLQIVEYIKQKNDYFERQFKAVSDVIAKLTEYRSALITNAVTGKIDVRDFVVPSIPS